VKQGSASSAAGKAFYDDRYARPGHYQGVWKDSPYRGLWAGIAKKIPPGSRILDVGCGPAQLGAALCELAKPVSYRGFDFSRKAIALAQQNLRPFSQASASFGDCRKQAPFGREWDVMVCTEVLEHLDDDHGIFRKGAAARPGALVLFTVPNADSTSHVRFFQQPGDVKSRYEKYVDGLLVETHSHPDSRSSAKWFLGWGRLR